LAAVLDEQRASAVPVSQHAFQGQGGGRFVEHIAEPAAIGAGDDIERAAQLGAVGAGGIVPRGAGAGGAHSHDRDGPARLVAARIERDRRHARHRLPEFDQRDVVGGGEESHDQHRLAAGHGLVDQCLRQRPVARMDDDTRDLARPPVDHDLAEREMGREGMRRGHHPTRRDQHAMALTGHVDQRGEG